MEIIQISESKLKVMLTQEDLEEFDLDVDSLDYGDSETKEMFHALLSHIKEAVGFDTDGYRILVRLFPSRDGGCELFVTRLEPFPLDAKEIPLPLHPYKTPSENKTKPHAFGFDELRWLIAVCRRLRNIGYRQESSAYVSDDHRFYLFLEGNLHTAQLPLHEYSFITEYGSAESAEFLRSFLGEHGKIICEHNAVGQLGVL